MTGFFEDIETSIGKNKLKIIVGAVIFATVLNWIVITNSTAIVAADHIWQFLFVTVTSYLATSLIFGVTFSDMFGNKSKLRVTLGTLFIFSAIDLIAPPYLIGIDGVINNGAFLSGGAIDTIFWDLLHGYLSGFMLYIGVYLIAFLVLFSIGVYILKEKTLLDIAR